ncbi:hypothetical protein LTR86_003200 [Recurvomyces mirabilis]|nr:hypothetical protein LTR86_003200 [Recurvomyces mirabilis]
MWRLLIWTTAAAISISTTHHLIWSHVKLHYPFRLLTIHIIAAFVFRAIWTLLLWWRQVRSSELTGEGARSLEARLQDALFVVAANATLGFGYKALLDMGSISTIAMALTMPLPLEHVVAQVLQGRKDLRSVGYLRISRGIVVTCCFAAIVLADRGLHGLGLIWTLITVASAMIARILTTGFQSRSSGGQGPDRRILLALTIGAPVAVLLAMFGEEDNIGRFSIAAMREPWLITLNIVASALALSMCCSIFGNLPSFSDVDEVVHGPPALSHLSQHSQVLHSTILTGLVLVCMQLTGRSTGLTLTQAAAYFMALLVQLFSLAAGGDGRPSGLVLREEDPRIALVDHEAEKDIKASNEKTQSLEVPTRDGDARRVATIRAILYILITSLVLIRWPSFWPWRLKSSPASTTPMVSLPRNGSLDIVVSRYQEPYSSIIPMLDSIHNIASIPDLSSTRIFIYDKAPMANDTLSADRLTSLYPPGVWITRIARPNIGREGETYLHHILSHYNDLAQHTLFLQAEPHDLQHALRRIQDYFHPSLTGFLTLSYPSNICATCEDCVDFSEWEEDPFELRMLQGAGFHGNQICKNIQLTYHGQFLVSSSRVRSNPPSFYASILDQFIDPGSDKHKAPYLNQTWNKHLPDSLSAPVFGYTLERMWGSIFGCSGEKIGVECPSLLSGTLGHKANRLDGCQCLDSESLQDQ